MRNIFLEKSSVKFVCETSPRRFFEKSKLSIPLDKFHSFFFFFACPSRGLPKHIETKQGAKHLLLFHIKLF